MDTFILITALLAGSTGIFLGFRTLRNFGNITQGKTTLRGIVLNSITAGMAGTLIFFSIIIVMSLLDETFAWSAEKILGVAVVPFIIGGVIAIGSFVQALIVIRYRDLLLGLLGRKGSNKNN